MHQTKRMLEMRLGKRVALHHVQSLVDFSTPVTHYNLREPHIIGNIFVKYAHQLGLFFVAFNGWRCDIWGHNMSSNWVTPGENQEVKVISLFKK